MAHPGKIIGRINPRNPGLWAPLSKEKAVQKHTVSTEGWVPGMIKPSSGRKLVSRKASHLSGVRLQVIGARSSAAGETKLRESQTQFEGLRGENRRMLSGFTTPFTSKVKAGAKRVSSLANHAKEKLIEKGEPYIEIGKRKVEFVKSKIPNKFENTLKGVAIGSTAAFTLGAFTGGLFAVPALIIGTVGGGVIGLMLDIAQANKAEEEAWVVKNLKGESRNAIKVNDSPWAGRIKKLGRKGVSFAHLAKDKGIKFARLYERKVHQPATKNLPNGLDNTVKGLGVGLFIGLTISSISGGVAAPLAMPLCTAVGGLIGLLLDISKSGSSEVSSFWGIKNIEGRISSVKEVDDPSVKARVKKHALRAHWGVVKGAQLFERKIFLPVEKRLPNAMKRSQTGARVGRMTGVVLGILGLNAIAIPVSIVATSVGLVVGMVLDVGKASRKDQSIWAVKNEEGESRDIEEIDTSTRKGKAKAARRKISKAAKKGRNKALKGAQIIDRKVYDKTMDVLPEWVKEALKVGSYAGMAAEGSDSSLGAESPIQKMAEKKSSKNEKNADGGQNDVPPAA